MKFNKWTLGLAAVGAVSLASAARADEAKLSQVQTALSNTTISGYVSSSVNWQVNHSGDNDSIGESIPLQNGKANGFNLDVVKLSISKPQDESEWASGYQVDLLFGPDAGGYDPAVSSNNGGVNSASDFGILQAYVLLRTPIGNGIDWKIGQFNTIIGYESFDSGSNPNYTRSWAWAVEPTTHTGILGSYKVNDELSFSAGVANTLSGGINTRNNHDAGNENTGAWSKAFMGSATFTAPSNWGWAAGSAFYAGMVYGFNSTYQSSPYGSASSQAGNQANYYAGATLNSPWKNVTFGASFDYVQNLNGGSGFSSPNVHANDYIFGLYNTIKVTDKLSFNSRAEYWEVDAVQKNEIGSDCGVSLTETIQYDIWANVVSRLEFRYDKIMDGTWANAVGYYTPTGVSVWETTSVGLYANIIYKF
jgi:hypothetical protein